MSVTQWSRMHSRKKIPTKVSFLFFVFLKARYENEKLDQKRLERNMDSLFDAIEETLKSKGILDQLSCSVRAEVLQVLKNPEKSPSKRQDKLDPDSTNFLINELIKEYLDYNAYEHTSNVLAVESGQPKTRANRNDLEAVLKVHTGPNAKQVPLLYSIVSSLRKK